MSKRASKKTGRQTSYTAKLGKVIADAIAAGNYFVTACSLAGVTKQTGYNWLAKGQAEDAPQYLIDFFDSVKKAEAQAESKALGRLKDAAQGGQVVTRKTTTRKDGSEVVEETYTCPAWQADAWFLERRMPQKWGKQDRPGPEIDYSKLTDEQLRRIEAGEDPLIVIATSETGEGASALVAGGYLN